jgi:two-component sensor histidine kinase
MPAATAVAAQARSVSDDGRGNVYIARDGLYLFTNGGHPIRRVIEQPVIAVYCEGDSVWYSHPRTTAVYSRITNRRRMLRQACNRAIWTYYRDREGRLLAGGNKFIGFVSGDSIIALKACGGDTLAGTCYQFLKAQDGHTWAVTDNGLFEVGPHCYKRYGNAGHSLPSNRLQYIYESAGGTWWLCTGGDGLIGWNPKTGVVRRFNMANGLPSNVIYACFPDARGLLWLSSNNGLIRFHPESGMAETFTKKDGLPDNEFNRVSHGRSVDGRLYFGSLNGVTAFYPDAIPLKPASTYQPPLQVLSLQQYNAAKGMLVDKMSEFSTRGNILMEPDDRFLIMEVRLLDYAAGVHNYEYKVEGIDAAWRTSGDGMIRLDKVPYGVYTLCIRGQNAQNMQEDKELRILLTVIAPFYRKSWFIVGLIGLVILLLALSIRARVRILERANRKLEATVGKRTRELRDSLAQKDILMKEIHHRVKNNLQMISALQQMQASRSTDPQVKAALEESQNRVLSIAFIHHNLYQHDDLKGVEIVSFVEDLIRHVADVFSRPDVFIEVVRDIADVFLDIDTAVPLGLIINELLTNAYKYAFAGREEGVIKLAVCPAGPHTYELIFSDNGVGLPKGLAIGTAKSLGLRLISQLSRQLGGSIQHENKGGSFFRLIFKDYEARNRN